jgi:putative tricarboxylic transport membrane protein
VKSDGWKKVLTDKQWMDLYLAGDEFASFLKQENERVTATLKQIGLVK